MKKILMFAKPGGHLGFTFDQHVIALNADNQNRFEVHVANNEMTYEYILSFDIFWFYAKAFHPTLYNRLINDFPDKLFIVGPNVLLDKPDIGISDSWDDWLVNEAQFDLHLDQVKFYNNHVKKFFPDSKKKLSTYLDKCMRLDIFENDIKESNRDIDCLVYSKKRRYDKNFENFRENIIKGLNERNINYKEIVYGSYDKKEFLSLLLRAKVMINLSLDECPGILNYEAFYCNCHVIGSPHNVPSHYDEKLYVHNTDFMTEKYFVRKPETAKNYLEKIDWFFKDYIHEEKNKNIPREFVLRHTSYERYCDDVDYLLSKYCNQKRKDL